MNGRRFSGQERVALYLAQGGNCARCGIELEQGWHGDHMKPWSHGGQTDVINGQALCPTCNLKKGSKEENMGRPHSTKEPREWQLQAWEKYQRDKKNDWLLCATPGAGKTQWALGLARRLLDSNTIERVVIVAPTQTIRDQWRNQTIVNLEAVQNEHGGLENSKNFEGIVLTYAQVASQPALQRMGCGRAKTLVVFDEIHHAGFPNRSWGNQAKYAFEPSVLRIGLTGTPWRRPGSGQIPFVTYNGEGKVHVDFAYEYGNAVRDRVCRAVEFRAYNGEVKYTELDSCTHKTVVYTLEDEDDNTSILHDLLNPEGAWIHSMIQKAHTELLNIRRGEDGEGAVPDAKGLVIADAQKDALSIGNLLERMTHEKPAIIISDNPDSEQALEDFKTGTGKWAVAVNKVSEGVDVPALYVGVYATRKKTPLIFRQIVGRFVRRRSLEEERPAVLFMPAVATLIDLASDIESELRHEVDVEIEEYEKELQQEKLQLDTDPTTDLSAIPTDISPAELESVIHNGNKYIRAEYEEAVGYCERYNFRDDDVLKIAALLREIGKSTAMPTPAPQHTTPEETPLYKIKAALLKRVDHLAKRKALALGAEYKDFNRSLIRRFGGTRRDLTIEKLKEQLLYLENIDTREGTYEP